MSSNKNPNAEPAPPAEPESDPTRFRRTLISVLSMQVFAMVVLYMLQFFRP